MKKQNKNQNSNTNYYYILQQQQLLYVPINFFTAYDYHISYHSADTIATTNRVTLAVVIGIICAWFSSMKKAYFMCTVWWF